MCGWVGAWACRCPEHWRDKSGLESETHLEGGALFSECGYKAARRQQFEGQLLQALMFLKGSPGDLTFMAGLPQLSGAFRRPGLHRVGGRIQV